MEALIVAALVVVIPINGLLLVGAMNHYNRASRLLLEAKALNLRALARRR